MQREMIKTYKQNITSYLVGSVENGKSKLELYKFNSENNIVGPVQLNSQIEQDEKISKEIASITVTGTKLIKDIIVDYLIIGLQRNLKLNIQIII